MKLESEHNEDFRADEDADTLIITTAIKEAPVFQVVFIAGEDIDLLVILTALTSVVGIKLR